MELKILHLSDTHGVHRRLRDLPEADILVHSGGFTMSGSEAETLDFLEWLGDLPYRHKVLVAGNHDACLYGAHLDGLNDNVHYLCGSGVEIEDMNFWGVPMFMEDCMSGKQEQLYAAIPEDTDVLVTHTPPYGILDRDGSILYGSKELLERVSTIRPCLHLFGHIHKAHGMTNDGMTVFSNAAIMDEGYDSLNGPNMLPISAPEH
ncbi:MAG: metallophosphatase domain-containing protein [Candidatus Cryptobacteroides sp.]